MPEEAKASVVIGQRYGRWSVVGSPEVRDTFSGTRKRSRWWWMCRCDCGTEKWVPAYALVLSRSQSCGCLRRELHFAVHGTHGGTIGQRHHRQARLYIIWISMRGRCESPADKSFAYYGGRGISICSEWHDYAVFRDWALGSGYQENLTIDRVNNDGNYEPSNCRWADRETQNNNTRQNHWVTVWGETKTMAQWARDPRCPLTRQQLRDRLKGGWPPEEAMTTPLILSPANRRYARSHR